MVGGGGVDCQNHRFVSQTRVGHASNTYDALWMVLRNLDCKTHSLPPSYACHNTFYLSFQLPRRMWVIKTAVELTPSKMGPTHNTRHCRHVIHGDPTPILHPEETSTGSPLPRYIYPSLSTLRGPHLLGTHRAPL